MRLRSDSIDESAVKITVPLSSYQHFFFFSFFFENQLIIQNQFIQSTHVGKAMGGNNKGGKEIKRERRENRRHADRQEGQKRPS